MADPLAESNMFFEDISKRDSERQIHFFTFLNVFSVRVTIVNDPALANVKTQEQLDNLASWWAFSANMLEVREVYPTVCRMLAEDQQKFYFGTHVNTFSRFNVGHRASIFGYLDVRALLNVRLVSKNCNTAALVALYDNMKQFSEVDKAAAVDVQAFLDEPCGKSNDSSSVENGLPLEGFDAKNCVHLD